MTQSTLLKFFLDLFIILFILLFPHYSGLPMFIFPFIVLLVVWVYLKAYSQTFKAIGFGFKNITWKALVVGGSAGLLYAVLDYYLLPYLFNAFGLQKANLSDFNFIRHNFINFIFLIVIAWVIAIPFEEIAFRGFIFTKVKQWLPNVKWHFAISALITSILFALYHIQLGASGVVNAFIFALVISWLYKLCKGNLWYLIFFHAMYDTFMLNLIRLGYM